MFKPDWLKGRILILGLGREGLSTLNFLKSNWNELEIGVADRRNFEDFDENEKKVLLQINPENLHLGEDYLTSLNKYEVIFKTPGENKRKPEIITAIAEGKFLTSATNLFFEIKKGKVVAITGSKGKSTTASLIYQLLKAGGLNVELVGNIGRAALDYLQNDSPDKIYVFEISSYQLEDYQGGADIAVLVSFFPEHLDYHGSLENYFKAKTQLVTKFKPGLKVIYNYGNKVLYEFFHNLNQNIKKNIQLIPFNDGKNSLVRQSTVRAVPASLTTSQSSASLVSPTPSSSMSKNSKTESKTRSTASTFLPVQQYEIERFGEKLIDESQISLQGKHNLENILAALEIASLFKIPAAIQQKALIDFIPLEHRLELVGTFQKITFYNDAISTTPESTIAALETLSRKKQIGTLIAGGLDRGYNFDNLANAIITAKIKNLILLPESGSAIKFAIEKSFMGTKFKTPICINCYDMAEVVEKAYKITPPETICLLSCASPSYNLFKNFEERGNLFKNYIKNHELEKL